MIDHRAIDRRSLAFGRAIAANLIENPELANRARSNVARWLLTCSPRSRSTLLEWDAVLAGPTEEIVALLTSEDERATRLRQSNPFTGVLSNLERNAILREYRTDDAIPT